MGQFLHDAEAMGPWTANTSKLSSCQDILAGTSWPTTSPSKWGKPGSGLDMPLLQVVKLRVAKQVPPLWSATGHSGLEAAHTHSTGQGSDHKASTLGASQGRSNSGGSSGGRSDRGPAGWWRRRLREGAHGEADGRSQNRSRRPPSAGPSRGHPLVHIARGEAAGCGGKGS